MRLHVRTRRGLEPAPTPESPRVGTSERRRAATKVRGKRSRIYGIEAAYVDDLVRRHRSAALTSAMATRTLGDYRVPDGQPSSTLVSQSLSMPSHTSGPHLQSSS